MTTRRSLRLSALQQSEISPHYSEEDEETKTTKRKKPGVFNNVETKKSSLLIKRKSNSKDTKSPKKFFSIFHKPAVNCSHRDNAQNHTASKKISSKYRKKKDLRKSKVDFSKVEENLISALTDEEIEPEIDIVLELKPSTKSQSSSNDSVATVNDKHKSSSKSDVKLFPLFVSKASHNLGKENKAKIEGEHNSSVEEIKVEIEEVEIVPVKKLPKVIPEMEKKISFPLISFVNSTKEITASSDDISYSMKEDINSDCSMTCSWQGFSGLINPVCREYISRKKGGEPCLNGYDDKKTTSINHNVVETSAKKEILWSDRFTMVDNENIHNDLSKFKLWLSEWKSSNVLSKDSSYDLDIVNENVEKAYIVTGPPGCGKTSLVHHIANKLGFKVLEVNSSSRRNGHYITSQIQEAFSSYHMQGIKQNPLFIKCAKQSVSTNQKKEKRNTNLNNHFCKRETTPDETEVSKTKSISSSTLILFDDVDVIFDEDDGFWNAINSVLENSKKPIVFTVTQNIEDVTSKLNHRYEVLKLTPNTKHVCNVLENHCTFQNIVVPEELEKFAIFHANDVRRCLLNLQFWNGDIKLQDDVEFSSHILPDQRVNPKFMQDFYCRIQTLYPLGIDFAYNKLYSILAGLTRNVVQDDSTEDSLNLDNESSVESSKGQISRIKSSNQNLEELHILSSTFDNFCHIDHLKDRLFLKHSKWLSISERVRDWTVGLPSLSSREIHPQVSHLEFISNYSALNVQKCLLHWAKNPSAVNIFPDSDNSPLLSDSLESKINLFHQALPLYEIYKCCTISTDFYYALKDIAMFEADRELQSGKRSRRFFHYFKKLGLNVDIKSFI